ncbi:hypothetical protein FRC11_001381, partial [Ceratobasidium sp. 423]
MVYLLHHYKHIHACQRGPIHSTYKYSAWSSSLAETTSLAEHAIAATKSQLLVYAEEQDQNLLERCTWIQSTYASRAHRAAASQKYGYAELFLLGETIDR